MGNEGEQDANNESNPPGPPPTAVDSNCSILSSDSNIKVGLELSPSKSVEFDLDDEDDEDDDDHDDHEAPHTPEQQIKKSVEHEEQSPPVAEGLSSSFDSESSDVYIPSTDSGRFTHSLHTTMTREQKKKDIYKYYEVVKILGRGTMGTISCVRKKKKHLGGSARKKPKNKLLSSGKAKSFPKISSIPSAIDLVAQKTSLKRVESDLSVGSTSTIPHDANYEVVYALKTIQLDRFKDTTLVDELRNEMDILRSLDHPNIIRAIEIFDYKKHLCIVMELCSGGDLYSRVPYTEKEACKVVRKILSAVAYMHRCGIMHRDIKFENILFENESPDAEIKMVDFGLSKKYMPDFPHVHGSVGTIYSMSPQVLEGEYDSQADVWAIGVVAFMLISGQLPFFGKHRDEVIKKIMNCQYSFKAERWGKVSPEAKDLIRQLLQFDAVERPSAEDALKHKWVQPHMYSITEEGEETSSTTEDAHGEIIDVVRRSLEDFSEYRKIKKLALMVIAYKSTTQEIGFLRSVFEKFDVENNGTINFNEFKFALRKSDYTEKRLSEIFKGIDLDGSGFIHYTEFLAATIEARGVIVEERIAEAFDRLDSDDSGFISKDNLRGLLKGGFEGKELSEQLIQEVMDGGDFKRDGRISYEEFLMLWDEPDDQFVAKTLTEVGRVRTKSKKSLFANISSCFPTGKASQVLR